MRGTRRNKPQDPSNNGSANEEEDDTTEDPTAERRNKPQDPQNNRSADEKEDDADAQAEDPIDAYSQKKGSRPVGRGRRRSSSHKRVFLSNQEHRKPCRVN